MKKKRIPSQRFTVKGPDDFPVSTTEAAAILGLSPRQTRRLAAAASIPAEFWGGGVWIYRKPLLEQYRSSARKAADLESC